MEESETDVSNRIAWNLRMAAALPGIDHAAEFEVPVFNPVSNRWKNPA